MTSLFWEAENDTERSGKENRMENLFTPIRIKGLELKNRIVMPPMCQFSVEAEDGRANDLHYVHYVSRAMGGVGLIILEMTNVEAAGRLTRKCLGLWSDEQIEPIARIVAACHKFGAKVAIQIGHGGRKADNAFDTVAPSAIRFSEEYKIPRALSTAEAEEMIIQYADAVERAIKAGVDSIEIHGAHGYLIHQFHSPLTNQRKDKFGEDKSLFGKEIIRESRKKMPADMPLIFRISAIEYVEGGYDLDYAAELTLQYKSAGADIFHVTSGGEGPLVGSGGRPGVHAGYQVPMARRIRQETDLPVIAVGKLGDFALANSLIGNRDADLVAVGRGLLQNPNWALKAAKSLDHKMEMAMQLGRAF